MKDRHFFDAIYKLRNSEEILLLRKTLDITPDDAADVAQLLHGEWDNECLEYPGAPPDFNEAAALWGARTLYLAAQLLLARELNTDVALKLLPLFPGRVDAGAMLSADLCLRMLPVVLENLRRIDPDDPLIERLESGLRSFHYSAVGLRLDDLTPDFSLIGGNPCIMQLYTDRVIERKDRRLAKLPELASHIAAGMGAWKPYFWNE